MKHQAGFTLLEILLVVTLLAVTSMVVVQTLPDDSQKLTKETASQFFYKLRLLSDDAVLNGQDYGVRFDEDKKGYSFMIQSSEGWQEIEKSKYYQKQTLPEDISLDYEIGKEEDKDSLFEGDDSLFEDNTGLFDDEKENEEKKKVEPPQLFVLSSGEVTPAKIIFTNLTSSEQQEWRIIVAENGRLYLRSLEEEDPTLTKDKSF